jgi:hypothetical protein
MNGLVNTYPGTESQSRQHRILFELFDEVINAEDDQHVDDSDSDSDNDSEDDNWEVSFHVSI